VADTDQKKNRHLAQRRNSSYVVRSIPTALDQAVSVGVSASRRRVSPELRVAFVV
jgi:hypothetical protein